MINYIIIINFFILVNIKFRDCHRIVGAYMYICIYVHTYKNFEIISYSIRKFSYHGCPDLIMYIHNSIKIKYQNQEKS